MNFITPKIGLFAKFFSASTIAAAARKSEWKSFMREKIFMQLIESENNEMQIGAIRKE